MAAETKTSVAARFANGAYVSASDFSTLIDSYMDHSDALFAIATAATNGSKGLVYVSGSATVTLYSAATVGLRVLNVATTAAAQQQIGGGTVGRLVFESVTTAATQQQLGGGTVGQQLFAVSTTAAANAIVGVASGATQAEMEAASSSSVFVTPERMRDHPAHPKAWAFISGGTSPELKASYNIASLVRKTTGEYNVTFSRAMANTNYAIIPAAQFETGMRVAFPTSAASNTAAGCGIRVTDSGGTNQDPVAVHLMVLGDH